MCIRDSNRTYKNNKLQKSSGTLESHSDYMYDGKDNRRYRIRKRDGMSKLELAAAHLVEATDDYLSRGYTVFNMTKERYQRFFTVPIQNLKSQAPLEKTFNVKKERPPPTKLQKLWKKIKAKLPRRTPPPPYTRKFRDIITIAMKKGYLI